MTLAIGMVCEGGLVFATDRRVSYNNDSIAEMDKLLTFRSDIGMFAIAQSSHDANAADSLARNIEYAIQNKTPNNFSFDTLEALIEAELRAWYVPVHDDRPAVQFLIGACLNEGKPMNRRIYFCEPPNTVRPIQESYKAIGEAWVLTDPMYKYWFAGFPQNPHSCLCCISYMMHKAKQLKPASVGGNTDAAIITEKSNFFAYHIDHASMAVAEANGGVNFDSLYLRSFVSDYGRR